MENFIVMLQKHLYFIREMYQLVESAEMENK